MSFYPKHLTFIFDGFSATNVAEIKFRFEIEQGFKLLKSLEHQLQSPKRTKVQNQPKAVFWIQSSFAVWHRPTTIKNDTSTRAKSANWNIKAIFSSPKTAIF
jgi:hypothetical protein